MQSIRRDCRFYYLKLNKTFKVSNKLKGKGYDPVTSADKTFEKFIRKEIKKKFPDHQVIGEEFGHKKNKSNNFSGTATKALTSPPPPSSLVATFFEGFFLELQKKLFF